MSRMMYKRLATRISCDVQSGEDPLIGETSSVDEASVSSGDELTQSPWDAIADILKLMNGNKYDIISWQPYCASMQLICLNLKHFIG